MSVAAGTTRPPRRHCEDSSVSRPGCGVTRRCWISWAGCVSTTDGRVATSGPRRGSTAWTFIACIVRSTRSSPTWTESTRLPRTGPGSVTPAARGELNVGQLVRERHPGDCRLIGFTTYTGTVTAAGDREGPAERKWVQPALPDS